MAIERKPPQSALGQALHRAAQRSPDLDKLLNPPTPELQPEPEPKPELHLNKRLAGGIVYKGEERRHTSDIDAEQRAFALSQKETTSNNEGSRMDLQSDKTELMNPRRRIYDYLMAHTSTENNSASVASSLESEGYPRSTMMAEITTMINAGLLRPIENPENQTRSRAIEVVPGIAPPDDKARYMRRKARGVKLPPGTMENMGQNNPPAQENPLDKAPLVDPNDLVKTLDLTPEGITQVLTKHRSEKSDELIDAILDGLNVNQAMLLFQKLKKLISG